ncbi:MAG TPA: PKD domain-containing protein [Euryarchaeota archaeon]|nr:PKD domain-containing protein [Euryarchaeota archaeon]
MGGRYMKIGRKGSILLIAIMLLFGTLIPIIFQSPSVIAQEELSELYIGSIQTIDSASPYLGIQDISYVFYGLVYGYLIAPDENMNPSPDLANSWWYMDGPTAISLGQDFSTFLHHNPADWPLGSIWEYNITEDVFWNDGTPFTAEDIEWTINIQIGANFMTYWAYQPYTRWIYKAVAVDDLKLRIFFSDLETKEPFPAAFGDNLFIPIMPKHRFSSYPATYLGYTWDGTPAIGTGPFMGTAALRDEVISGERITLLRNPYYNFKEEYTSQWVGLGAAFNRSTEIEKLVIKFFTEESTLSIAVRTGDIDVAEIGAMTYLCWLQDATKPDTLNLVSMLGPTAYSKEIAINAYEEAPGTLNSLRLDPAVTRAASLATNKTYIKDQFYKGLAMEGYHIVATPVWEKWWWEPDTTPSTFYINNSVGETLLSYTKPLNEVMGYDMGLANMILDEAGYEWTGTPYESVRKAGPLVGARMQHLFGIPQDEIIDKTLSFECVTDNSDLKDKQITEYMASEWIKAGIAITPQYVDAAQWSAMVYSYTYEVHTTYWSGDIDPNYLCFIPTSYSMFGWNEFGVSTPDYDYLYLQQARTFNYTERYNWVSECCKWQYLSGSIITTVYPQTCYAFNENRWTNWGDWTQNPRLAFNAYWPENPLWFSLTQLNAPSASFTAEPSIGQSSTIFNFDASSSSDIDYPLSSLQVRWDWENDGIWDTDWLTEKTRQHVFYSAGDYIVKMEIKNPYGLKSSTTRSVIVDDTAPIANAGYDSTVFLGSTAILNGSASSDNIGIVNYTWSYFDETAHSLYGRIVGCSFSNAGTFSVTLNVTDEAGNSANDTVTITVVDIVNPVAEAGPLQTVNAGEWVTLNGSGSTDDVGIVNYTWSFVYGGNSVLLFGMTASYKFDNPGTYDIILFAKDGAGNTGSDSVRIIVEGDGGAGSEFIEDNLWWISIVIVVAVVGAFLIIPQFRKGRSGKSD